MGRGEGGSLQRGEERDCVRLAMVCGVCHAVDWCLVGEEQQGRHGGEQEGAGLEGEGGTMGKVGNRRRRMGKKKWSLGGGG